MFTVKRNQVVVTALAVMIAAAGYLNFQETKSAEGTKTAMELTEEGDMAALMEEDYAALPDDVPTEEGALDPLTAEASTTTGMERQFLPALIPVTMLPVTLQKQNWTENSLGQNRRKS